MSGNETATGVRLHQAAGERNRRMFELMIEQFSADWRPEDRYEGAEFDSQFHSIVRQIYRDAQQPLLDHIVKMTALMPNPTIITEPKR